MMLRFHINLFSLACLAAFAAAPDNARAEWNIGISLPLATNARPLAQQFLNGAEQAVDAHNQKGGETTRLTVVDDGCDPELAGLAAADLKAADVDIVTGLICNDPVYTLADALDSNTPLLVAGARSVRILKDRERRQWNVWQIAPDDLAAPRAASEMLSRRWEGEPFAIVDDGTVYGRNMADGFRTAMEELGFPAQFQDTFRPTQSTQARLVRRLRRAGTTHVFVGASAEDIAMIARNSAELEIPLVIAGGEELGILPFFEPENQPSAGVLAVLAKNEDLISRPARIDPEDPSAETLLEALGPPPYKLLGMQAVEIALAALAQNAENPTEALSGKRFETRLGPVAFSPKGANTTPYFALYRWSGERFEKADDPS